MCQLTKVKNINIYAGEKRRDEAEWRVPVGDIEKDALAAATRAKASWKVAFDKGVVELELEQKWTK